MALSPVAAWFLATAAAALLTARTAARQPERAMRALHAAWAVRHIASGAAWYGRNAWMKASLLGIPVRASFSGVEIRHPG
eukprot:352249-Chlamydomonas_euryale.AAC.20